MTSTAAPTCLSFDSAGIRMTPEEFDAVEEYDDLYRYELIDGRVFVNPIASEAEADPNEILGVLLGIYKRQHPNGHCLDRTLQERYIHFSNHRRRADRVIWAGLGRLPDPKSDIPTIVIEFVSPGKRSAKRDYEEKKVEYMQIGVVEYWIIDRFRRKMTVYRNSEQGSIEIEVGEQEIYTTDILPGFELPLDELLSAADEWDQPQS